MAKTLRAIEAILNPDGRVEMVSSLLTITKPTQVILTVVVDDGGAGGEENDVNLASASETAWAKDWNRNEEDDAWASLQEETSS